VLTPFSPPPGLISDDTTFSGAGWVDGNNVRFRMGRPQTIGGYAIAINGLPSVVRNIIKAGSNGSLKMGAASKLFSDGNNVSPTPSAGADSWSLQMWGSVLLANPTGGKLYEQSGLSAATVVTEAPAQMTVMLVTPQRQVMALGTNEVLSGVYNPLCIRLSDLEDYSSLGSWTPTSTNNSDEIILDAGGSIKGAAIVGEYVAVFTEDPLYLGQFIGDPQQAFRFDRVADGCGLLNPNTVTTLNGVVYFIGQDMQLRAWQPGSPPQAVPCPILRDVTENALSDFSKVIMGPNTRFSEIWVFYPDSRDGTGDNSRYFAYCAGESAAAQRPVWFRGQLARTAIYDSGLESDGSPSFVLAAGTDILYHEYDVGQIQHASSLTSADQYLDNSQRRLMVRSFIPDFEYQSGDVALTVYCRDRPQSMAVTKGPYTIGTTATKKDFRASGKIVSVKFSGNSVRYRLGKPCFDTVPLGER
jgi:hypothetical protein